MKYIAIVLVLALVGCTENEAAPVKDLSYQELKDLPLDCEFSERQLSVLKDLQRMKNFDPDPDMLSEPSRKYNSMLKAKIWWYAVRCAKS